eukprot:TRINITY_DN7998_c0_g2_i1.p4 TRINITY_DN7998_c0_g2~~TRINITY_DN7998_c0_g2_i1.p4  ORF type:complete len:214 (+),score=55.46 TRINITY_DN7998_c0_g2_i1:756-1397(+)
MCGLYISKKMNKQWIETMNMLSSGELILSNTLPPRVLYHNAAFVELMKKTGEEEGEEMNIEEVVNGLTVEELGDKSDGGKEELKEKLVDFINAPKKNNLRNCKCFLDHEELVIEIKVNKLIFNGEDANIVSFIDCSSAKELEKTQIECKYKTILISSISHELRSPVNYILNALDLVSSFLPSTSMGLLEMSKECCNMIIAHINDLTVLLLLPQ